jgi:hypothetical protein
MKVSPVGQKVFWSSIWNSDSRAQAASLAKFFEYFDETNGRFRSHEVPMVRPYGLLTTFRRRGPRYARSVETLTRFRAHR